MTPAQLERAVELSNAISNTRKMLEKFDAGFVSRTGKYASTIHINASAEYLDGYTFLPLDRTEPQPEPPLFVMDFLDAYARHLKNHLAALEAEFESL